jgi:hypothetical protein
MNLLVFSLILPWQTPSARFAVPASPMRNVRLQWQAGTVDPNCTGVCTIGGYNIYRAPSVSGPWNVLNPSPVPGLTYLDSTAVIGQVYSYAATSVLTGGCSLGPNSSCESALSVPVPMFMIPLQATGPPPKVNVP